MASPLRTVLFDLDGTLLDTAPDMIGALNRLREEERASLLPYDDVRPLVSHGAGRLVKFAFPEAEQERSSALQKRFLEIYRSGLSLQTRLFPGMDEALGELAGQRMTCGIVTNKPAWLTAPLLEELHLTSRFVCVVSGDTLRLRKPHPLPLLHAAELAGVAAAECIYVGDAERDVQAGHAAGMQALVATYGYLDAGEDWQAWNGDGSIDSPRDLVPWLAASGRL